MTDNLPPGHEGEVSFCSDAAAHTRGLVGRPSLNPILLVEDDAELTLATLAALSPVNEVIRASDGASAIHWLFGSEGPPTARRIPALIILDLHLPDVDGLSVLTLASPTHLLPLCQLLC